MDVVKLSHMEFLNGCMCVTAHLVKLIFTVPTVMRRFVFSLLPQMVRNGR